MELKETLTNGIILVILLNIGICLNSKPDSRNPLHCLQRRNNLPADRCKKSCLRDSDCKARRKCWCDGLCGPSCIRLNAKCPKLRDIAHGRVQVDDPTNRFGSIAKYFCNSGYSFKDEPTPRVCQGDETWYGEEPACFNSTVKCPPPPKIPNTNNDAPQDQVWFLIGSVYVYDCLTGYQPQPDAITHAWCLKDGIWLGPSINCTHDGCTDLDDIRNGWVEQKRPNTKGSVAKYYCKSGFRITGSNEKLCNEDGLWVGSTPTCDKVTCGQPPYLTNGRYVMEDPYFDGDQFVVGLKFLYTCEYGYRGNGGNRYAVCGEAGEWVGPELKCEAQNCGPPGELTYGRIIADSGYSSPSRVTFLCDKGFLRRGHSESVCQPSGHWSNPVPTCEPINCPPLIAPLHGYMDQTGISYGSVVRFQCDIGYRLRGPSERRCQPDKTWEGQEVRCEEIDCGEVFFDNGRIVGRRTTFGSEITYQCRDYTTYGEIHTPFTAICLEDGTWSNPPPKCLGHCLVPEIKNATLIGSIGNQYEKHGNVVEYSCNKGFTPTDSTRMACNNGTWSAKGACVPAPCPSPPPHVPEGLRVFLSKDHGDKAKYKCNAGYRMKGLDDGSYLTCRYGQWVGGQPVCEEIYCPSPTLKPIPNGKIWKKVSQARFIFKEYILRIRHGDMLEYECNEGFQIEGAGGATCVDGVWQPPLGNPDTKCVPALHPPFIKLWTPLPNLYT